MTDERYEDCDRCDERYVGEEAIGSYLSYVDTANGSIAVCHSCKRRCSQCVNFYHGCDVERCNVHGDKRDPEKCPDYEPKRPVKAKGLPRVKAPHNVVEQLRSDLSNAHESMTQYRHELDSCGEQLTANQDSIERLTTEVNDALSDRNNQKRYRLDLSDEVKRLRTSAREAYEALLGDTEFSAWHSEHCYRSGAHQDSSNCVCGLLKAQRILRSMTDLD